MTVRRLLAHRDALREVAIFAIAYVVYFGVRAVTEGTAASAMQNAMDLIRFEQRIGIAWEGAVQEAVVGSRLLLDLANAVYMYGHWPVIIVTGVLLFRHRRSHARRTADGRARHGTPGGPLARHGQAGRHPLDAGRRALGGRRPRAVTAFAGRRARASAPAS